MGYTTYLVHEFHRAFGVEVQETPGLPEHPDGSVHESETVVELCRLSDDMRHLGEELHTAAEQCSGDTRLLRLQLLQEELAELAEAIYQEDLVACLDALCDLQYVLDGTILSLGMQDIFWEAFVEVHKSNMTKLDAQGNPVVNEAGSVVKSDQFREPDLHQFIDRETPP